MDRHEFKKEFGQNFLRSSTFPKIMVKTLCPLKEESVLEIGPGDGKLTHELLCTESNIYAVEIDTTLIPILLAKFSTNNTFHLVNQDILSLDTDKEGNKYSVIGSLPYNISKKIINKFLRASVKPRKMVFIIQKEVADDYVAEAPRATFLSNYVKLFSIAKIIKKIPSGEFYPRPKVDGAIIEFELIPEIEGFKNIVINLKQAFTQPRKKLSSNLQSTKLNKGAIEKELTVLGYNPNARPSEIKFDDWITLSKLL